MIFSRFISLLRTLFSLLFLTLSLSPLLSSFPLFFLPFACYLSLFTYFFLSLFTLFSLLHSCIYCLCFFLVSSCGFFHCFLPSLGFSSYFLSLCLFDSCFLFCFFSSSYFLHCFHSSIHSLSLLFSSHFFISHLCLHCLFPLNISCPFFLVSSTPLWSQLFSSLVSSCGFFHYFLCSFCFLCYLFSCTCYFHYFLSISFPCVLGMSFLLLFPLYVFPLLSLLLFLNVPLLSSVSLLP